MIDPKVFNSIVDHAYSMANFRLSEPLKPQELLENSDIQINESPSENFKELVDQVLKYSVNTQNPRFLNQLYGGTAPEIWAGELLVSILNTSMATYEIAPFATLCEKELVSAINVELGFDEVEGLMVPGGSYANMVGLHCARYRFDPDLKRKGLSKHPPFSVFVSSDAHYSTEKAMGLMGLGINHLVKVETDELGKMNLEDLSLKIEESRSRGEMPLCVVSTAGTTVWGAFDSLEGISKITEKNGMWHHVDAAWGGLCLWSKDKDRFFKGVEKVDSITMDYHKLMGASLTKAFFVTRHPQTLKEANAGGGTEYIFHESPEAVMNTGTYALQCGRKVDSIPLWLWWKSQGTEGFRNKITEFLELRDWLVEFFDSNSNKFQLLRQPEFVNFCFQVVPKDSNKNVSDHNISLRERLMADGKFMVNKAQSAEHGSFFRLVLNHWGVNKEILTEFFEELKTLDKES